MNLRTTIASFLVASTAACTSTDDQDWTPPAAVDGKADAIDLLEGSTIPSSYVDPAKRYLRSRTIEALKHAGALDELHSRLATRVDGIVANAPANGKLDAAELVKMEQPEIFGSLFPDEQAAVPHLWEILEAPTTKLDVQLAPAPTHTELPPQAPALPDTAPITDRPTEAMSLRRLQLQFDADSDDNTFSLDDLKQGIANPDGRYTPAEVTDFNRARDYLGGLRTAVRSGTRTLVIPSMTPLSVGQGAIGPATLQFERTAHVKETLNAECGTRSQGMIHINEGFRIQQPTAAGVVVYDSFNERGTLAADTLGPSLGKDSVVEIWQNGTRIASAIVTSRAATPAIKADDYFGWHFTAAANAPAAFRRLTQSGTSSCVERYMWSGIEPSGSRPVTGQDARGPATRQFGQYEWDSPLGKVGLEIYEGPIEPVVYLVAPGVRVRGTNRHSQSAPRFDASYNSIQFIYNHSLTGGPFGTFNASRTTASFNTTVHGADRVK